MIHETRLAVRNLEEEARLQTKVSAEQLHRNQPS
jgi:hypothetical protein